MVAIDELTFDSRSPTPIHDVNMNRFVSRAKVMVLLAATEVIVHVCVLKIIMCDVCSYYLSLIMETNDNSCHCN